MKKQTKKITFFAFKLLFLLQSCFLSHGFIGKAFQNKLLQIRNSYQSRQCLRNYRKRVQQHNSNDDFRKFAMVHMPPENVVIDLMMRESNDPAFCVEHYTANDFTVKCPDVNRIINAARVEKIINQERFQHIHPVKKYMYLTKDGWFNVIAEKIKHDENGKVSLPQIKELVRFVGITKFSDFFKQNVLLNKQNGKFAFIDLEDYSFFKQSTDDRLKALKDYCNYDHDASLWMKNMVNAVNNEDSNLFEKNQFKSVPLRDDLDESTININNVRCTRRPSRS